jgi:hypothetical protein
MKDKSTENRKVVNGKIDAIRGKISYIVFSVSRESEKCALCG